MKKRDVNYDDWKEGKNAQACKKKTKNSKRHQKKLITCQSKYFQTRTRIHKLKKLSEMSTRRKKHES